MARYHEGLKYHEDKVKKHSITEEELEFLIRLQKEMNTQDTVSQAGPRFWVIKGTEQKTSCYENGDDFALFNSREAEKVARTMKEAYEYIKDKDFEEIMEIKFDAVTDTIRVKYDLFDYGENPEETELEFLEDAEKFLNKIDDAYRLSYLENYDKIYSGTMFLTQKEAEEHLRANDYHYSEDAHTYAMTAWRAPDVEKLWKILQEVDWKELQGKEQLPAKIGQEMYFILNDKVDEKSINGWVVSHPHKVIDVSTRGFFTGDEEDFPYNTDFTKWEQLGKDVFTSEKEAWEEARKRGLKND